MILCCSGADTRAYNHSNMNPFMLAIESGLTHLSVANAMAKKDPSLVVLKLDSDLTVNNWAQEKGHDAFFKVCFVAFLSFTYQCTTWSSFFSC